MKFFLFNNQITPECDIEKDVNLESLKQVYCHINNEHDPVHKITISNTKNYILVKVGDDVAHPMNDEEYIEFMMLEINKKIVNKINLNKNGEPNAIFNLDIQGNNLIGSSVRVYIYCNKTGLWEKTYVIE